MTANRRTPRHPLERERIIEEAVRIADEHGLDAVTMRKLARSLGVQAMSLYHHVPSKEALLAAMLDAIYERMALPRAEEGWRDAMRARAASMRQAFRDHPWSLGLVDTGTNPGPAALNHTDSLLGTLRSAGFSVPMAAHAMAVFDAFVYGFAVQERNLPFTAGPDVADVATDVLASIPEGVYPHLQEFALEHVMTPGYDFGDEFAFGLELVLDGIERVAGRDGRARP